MSTWLPMLILTCLSFSQPALRSRTLHPQKQNPTRVEAFSPSQIPHELRLKSVKRLSKFTDLLLLFRPRQENHHLPPFLGIFSFTIFSTVAWGREQNGTQTNTKQQ